MTLEPSMEEINRCCILVISLRVNHHEYYRHSQKQRNMDWYDTRKFPRHVLKCFLCRCVGGGERRWIKECFVSEKRIIQVACDGWCGGQKESPALAKTNCRLVISMFIDGIHFLTSKSFGWTSGHTFHMCFLRGVFGSCFGTRGRNITGVPIMPSAH